RRPSDEKTRLEFQCALDQGVAERSLKRRVYAAGSEIVLDAEAFDGGKCARPYDPVGGTHFDVAVRSQGPLNRHYVGGGWLIGPGRGNSENAPNFVEPSTTIVESIE